MTPEAQRIAIAKACDLEVIDDPRGPIDTRKSPYTLKRKVYYTPEAARNRYKSWPKAMTVPVIPNYLKSLDAMYEAEKHLTHDQGREYYAILSVDICFSPVAAVRATAAQRAEAFLRTLNLWEE
jgi:hypothetical protein